MTSAALGFRVHSGWAALVAVAGSPRSPRVVARERIEMADGPADRQPYHAAEGLDLPEAERFLKRCARGAETKARKDLARVLRGLRGIGCAPGRVGILQASGRLPADVARVLASHALIHTADGVHFRGALARVAQDHGLGVARVPERELLAQAARALGRPPGELQREVAAWGRGLGPPWTADQKLAALAAWMLLA